MRVTAVVGSTAMLEGRAPPGTLGHGGGTEDDIWTSEGETDRLLRLSDGHCATKSPYHCFEEF